MHDGSWGFWGMHLFWWLFRMDNWLHRWWGQS